MLIKEWTIDDMGRPVATWVESERVSSVQCAAPGEITAKSPESKVLVTDSAENGVGTSGPVLDRLTLPGLRGHSAPSRASKVAYWTRVYMILRSILP
jgi:hypothetical protein